MTGLECSSLVKAITYDLNVPGLIPVRRAKTDKAECNVSIHDSLIISLNKINMQSTIQ